MNGISGEDAAAYCRGLRPDRRGKIEAVKLVSSTSLWGIPKHSKIFQRNVETLRLVPLKSLGWMPKSLEILRTRPQVGNRKKLGKRLQNDLRSLPSRSAGFARPGCPVGAAGPKVGVLPRERTVPKGPKASRQKQNGVIMTRFLTNRFEVAKVVTIVVSGGFRCGACW